MENNICIVLALVQIFIGSTCFGSSVDEHIFQDSINFDGKTLRLNGTGIRKATIFNVEVYAAGLYLEQKSLNALEILNSKSVKIIEMKFLRDVSSDKMKDAWKN